MEPLVTIIIPVYNTEKYIEQCITNITSQTYTNIEAIIVTEPCTDRSETICDQLAQCDNRIRVIHKKELSGVSRSRNIGLREAHGEYLMFVDSDDYIRSDMINIMMSYLRGKDIDLVMCGREEIYEDANAFKSTPLPTGTTVINPDCFKYLLGKPGEIDRFGGYVWSYLIKTEAVFQNDSLITFNENLNHSEDIHWLTRIMLNCKSISYINEPLYCYRRMRPGNTYSEISRKKTLLYSDSAIMAYTEIYRLLERNKIKEKNNAYWRIIKHKKMAWETAKLMRDKEKKKKYFHGIIKMLIHYAASEGTFHSLSWSFKVLASIIKKWINLREKEIIVQ